MNRRGISVGAALFAALAAGNAGAQQPGWSIVLEAENRYVDELYSVQFLTRHVGWAVGDSRQGYTGIHYTGDGGRTWQRLDLFDGQEHPPEFSAVRFADASHGWIATRTGSLVLRTVDGGESWIPVEMRNVDHVLANDMLTVGTEGLVIAADGGLIHRTIDGGASWQHSNVSHPGDVFQGEDVTGLAFAPPSTLYAVTRHSLTDHGGIHRSDDGGATWQTVLESPQGLRAIAFRDDANGVAVGRNAAYWTRDGGATWTRALAAGERYDVQYLDAATLVAGGYDPAVLVSRDGGRTWRPAPHQPPDASRLLDLQLVDAGWWFATSDRPARLYFQFDPAHEALLADGRIILPSSVTLGEAGPLPPGEYEVAAGHVGHEHALALSLVTPAEGVEIGVEGELAENQYACSPCEDIAPVAIEYEMQELGASDAGDAALGLRLEPTSDGVAIVLDARVPPPADAAGLLAALGASEDTDVDLRSSAGNGGSLFGRLKKAASGDVRGAVAGVNPKAAVNRARAAEASPPSVYRVTLRYPLSLTSPAP